MKVNMLSSNSCRLNQSIDMCGFIPSRLLHFYSDSLHFYFDSRSTTNITENVWCQMQTKSIDINKNRHITQMDAKLKPSQKLTDSNWIDKTKSKKPKWNIIVYEWRQRRCGGSTILLARLEFDTQVCEHVSDFQCLIQRQQVLYGWKCMLTKIGECKWIAHRSNTNEGSYFCLACVRPRAICFTLKSKAFTWYWHERNTIFIWKMRLKVNKIIFCSAKIDSFWQLDGYKWHWNFMPFDSNKSLHFYRPYSERKRKKEKERECS